MKKIKLGIVMLTYNRADVVVPCLESLCSAKNDSEFEIYILDNASEFDQYKTIKDKFELLKIENNLNRLYWIFKITGATEEYGNIFQVIQGTKYIGESSQNLVTGLRYYKELFECFIH